MRQFFATALFGIALSSLAVCQPSIYLKNRQIDTSIEPQPVLRTSGARAVEAGGRVHRIVQFGQYPGEAEANILTSIGATVLGYVHENGLMISIDSATALDGRGFQWWGALQPQDKISSLLPTDSTTAAVLVEMHSDADLNAARSLAVSLGMQVHDNPDTPMAQLLGVATGDQIAALAGYDMVAYIFPASDELMQGQPSQACASALTTQGGTAQYIARVGDGWDGPGQGSAAITYSWGAMTAQLNTPAAQAEIVRAFNEWTKHAKLTFTPTDNSDARQNINVLFGKRAHGDPYPFDGRGGVLAHTFYPSPPNPEPLAGDMHFDDDESWNIGANTDLFSVALHETGHALGLGHSDQPGAVMYPYYRRASALSQEDIAAVLSLYAAQDNASSGATPVTPPAIPPPVNPPGTPPAAPFALAMNAPPAAISTDSVRLSGAATGGIGDPTVRWTSNRGWSGNAQGSRAWSLTAPLATGSNTITIVASDAANTTLSKSVAIVRQAAPASTAVNLQITYPGNATAYTVRDSALRIRGTASHPSGIARVSWSNSRGGSGIAAGDAMWDSGTVSLSEGMNAITVQATSTDNSIAARTLLITYARPSANDTTPPTLVITSPATATFVTSARSIVLQGTANDSGGVASVVWFSLAGESGTANGTTNWSTPAIPLYAGNNTIIVRAFDNAGNMSWRSVQVMRQ